MFEKYFNKNITVIGLGVSNRPLVDILLKEGHQVSVRDKSTREALGDYATELEQRGCKLILGQDYLENITENVIFRTPGLHPFTPQLASAIKRGAILTSEMEAFFAVCPCKIIAVTGSDGKTTTTTVISELLKAAGYKVYIGGNIGHPLLAEAQNMSKDDMVVLELSSFQLHSMICHPNVAVVTNVSPNHLDIHPSYEDYQWAKKQIFALQNANDKLVLNFDNAITHDFASEAKGQVFGFSRQSKMENGVYSENGVIYRSQKGQTTTIMNAEDIRIPGLHNVENFMAAFAATEGLVSDEICVSVAKSFAGVAHRLEMLRTLHGVTYCNDSIASSPTRTIAGLRALKQKPILIAGGYDKHIPFDELGDEICQKVKALYLTGFTADKIEAAVKNSKYYKPENLPIYVIDDFKQAVLAASQGAKEGDLVLLSPACASFDKFKNFEQRGNTFREIVNELE